MSSKKKPHQPSKHAKDLTSGAAVLLTRWQTGENFSEPSPDFGPFAYSGHAEIFISNAIRLCDDDNMSDFRVYGAIYLLRHGLELMLKCWLRNPQIDGLLRAVMSPGLTFVEVCARSWKDKKERESKSEILRHAVCALRNILEDGLKYPQIHQVNIDDEHAERALSYLRAHPDVDRFRFVLLWPVATNGHKLQVLWNAAAPVMEHFGEAARRCANESGIGAPMSHAELAALVDLLDAIDDGGDGLRYPSSIDGAWYTHAPRFSLQAVQVSAEALKATCIAFEDVRSAAYDASTLGRPEPY